MSQPITINQKKIYNAYWQFYRKYKKQPNRNDLVKLLDLSYASVKHHLCMLRDMDYLPQHGKSLDGYSYDKNLPTVKPKMNQHETAKVGSGVKVDDSLLSAAVLAFLQRKKNEVYTLIDLCTQFDATPKAMETALTQLRDGGYNLMMDAHNIALVKEELEEYSKEGITPFHGKLAQPVKSQRHRYIKFGIISDTHLGCKKERLDVLNDLYHWYASEEVDTVYHAGNMIEGESRFNVQERHVHGLDAQVDYFIDKYPHHSGIKTYYIAGDDHEGWYQQREGISIGRYIETRARQSGREDLHYLGYLEHDIAFTVPNGGEFVMKIMHPGGGSAYALSYTPQKIVESFSGGEKPAVLILGHYHKLEYIPQIRGCRVIQAGCTVGQGVWARKKRLQYHLGGWILTLVQDLKSGACVGCTAQDRTYFNSGYYQQWE